MIDNAAVREVMGNFIILSVVLIGAFPIGFILQRLFDFCNTAFNQMPNIGQISFQHSWMDRFFKGSQSAHKKRLTDEMEGGH